MDETNTAKQDQLLGKGPASNGNNGSTSQVTTSKTYTDTELQQAVEKAKSDALAQAGRERKVIEDENKTLKSQLSTNQSLISDTQDRIEKLKQEVEDLSADDPDKAKRVKKLRDLEDYEDKLRSDRKVLEAEKLTHAETVKKAQEFSLRESISKVAGEFKNGNTIKLKEACDKLKITDESSIRTLAETFWERNEVSKEERKEVQITSVDGVTAGGGVKPFNKISFDKDAPSASEMIKAGLNKKK